MMKDPIDHQTKVQRDKWTHQARSVAPSILCWKMKTSILCWKMKTARRKIHRC